jgi:transcriptional regulator GlxA family with amidase domain
MDHAGWLLRTTDKSIGEICSIVGYNSETTFFKNFRNHYDMTPLQYRKQHQSTDI